MNNATKYWLAAPGDAVFQTVSESVAKRYLADEATILSELCSLVELSEDSTAEILRDARKLATRMRAHSETVSGLDSFMIEYDLSSREGVVLMCLAEALLRIPDSDTADSLIADKLADADFKDHLGASSDLLVNVSTWGLMLSGRIVKEELPGEHGLGPVFSQLLTRVSEPVIRSALRAAMGIMSEHFVMGETIEDALGRAKAATTANSVGERYSYDMLGEAALTDADADAYFEKYANAINAIGSKRSKDQSPLEAAGISVKLSALTPRFEHAQAELHERELIPRLRSLAAMARDAGIAMTIDAEESDRLESTLRIFESVYSSLKNSSDGHIGIAVQAYQKRAIAVIKWLGELARSSGRVIPVRLVKGAYWDTEIKLAQVRGFESYPVFTRKASTDVSYLACAKSLLNLAPSLYPQFATHNPHSAAWVMNQGAGVDFEFQRLHGMGEELYVSLAETKSARPCRVYAPVGQHKDLLPYLVRRLLENGANTSFVNRFVDAELDVEELIQDPIAVVRSMGSSVTHPLIPLPIDLFGKTRRNSAGLNLFDPLELRKLADALNAPENAILEAIENADSEFLNSALVTSANFFPRWNATPARQRSATLNAVADLFEQKRAELVAICVKEGGRCVPDALSEVREAVDFLRYYASEAERLYGKPLQLPGPTGESNELNMTGRGVFVCISPWNFPIAIFTGQIAAALSAGNTVIAKPAEQTPRIAVQIVKYFHAAGLPRDALTLAPGPGPEIGKMLLADPRVAGVAFTGSTATAKIIERTLADREGPIAALIAETGGINAMIVDSSALTEQVVRDTIASAFNSAGQRCSALRLLCLQEDSADEVIKMLVGRMRELVIGDPADISTDIGPVIDGAAHAMLQQYVDAMDDRILYRCPIPQQHHLANFFSPTLIQLNAVHELEREIFGPVLHVVRYDRDDADSLVDHLNNLGYGLTLGIQSRIDSFIDRIVARARVGNIYVNRDMIGAVVGVQPFGGLGLSGTGPKAGGPHYLARFGVEQTLTINTAAVGGNTELLAMPTQSS